MTTSVHCLGKLLCITLFAVPSPLMESKKATPSELTPLHSFFHTNTAFAARAARTKAIKARAAKRLIAAQRTAARQAELKIIGMEAHLLYEELQLANEGLDEKVLQYALQGYHRLLKRNEIQNPDILTICDFGQSSSQKRMYVIDLYAKKLLSRNYVAHGMSSGKEFASSFSNAPESHKSSLGFYVTRNTYVGENGLSLRLDGFDRGFNTLAGERNIVIHGASYVSDRILEKYGVMGTTYGCPAIPEELTRDLIPVLTGGSCFFIYYPSQRYLTNSSVLNG
ncbi:MAG TPA: murein L,D-transpeptidase catalytic domain family protein [Puia sp.]|nr:murein L,D-transpeptidase catalytic domain family protein [Puia sp.]